MSGRRSDYLSSRYGDKKTGGLAKITLLGPWVLVGLSLAGANVLAQPLVVNCPGDSIQAALNGLPPAVKRVFVVINGTCTENVRVMSDNVKFIGGTGGTVSGTITVDGARRVEFRTLTVTGAGNGVEVIRNGTATVQNSIVSGNHDNGIFVEEGAQVDILNNVITQNGQNPSDTEQGAGVWVGEAGSAEIVENTINDNLSYGVTVFSGAYARLESNTIMRNGRLSLFETGVGVFRAQVRANGNFYQDNGWAALDIFNDASYRTGFGLNADGITDNPFGFETIIAGTGQVAVSIGRGSNVDLRQVVVRGSIEISNDSLLHVRGDNVEPNTQCSEVDDITASGVNSTIQLIQNTRVNGVITANPNQGNRIASNTGCALP